MRSTERGETVANSLTERRQLLLVECLHRRLELTLVSHERVDPQFIGGYWADRIERMLQSCADERDVLPAGQSIDVPFDEFMADDVAMVERIYDLAGQPMTDGARAAMQSFMDEHPRGKFGGIEYDLGDFDLDPVERRRALRFYTDRFGVTEES